MTSDDRWSCPLCGETIVASLTVGPKRRRIFLAAARDSHPAQCRKARAKV